MPRRTKLTPTEREPRCDIEAQYQALINPEHPKQAMWISAGTEVPERDIMGFHGLEYLRIGDAGILIAGQRDVERLRADPSEEQLAEILDYVEPKSVALWLPVLWLPVVQARIGGRVVWEQIVSWGRIGDAYQRAASYGNPKVMSMSAVLARRKQLIALEVAARS